MRHRPRHVPGLPSHLRALLLDSLPPLDSDQFTGAFTWLGGAGDPIPRQVRKLNGLAKELSATGLTLPRDFVTFQTSENLYGSLDEVSVTGCWTNLSPPLPSPVEPGAFLVRFFRDQQDCVIWYLYLRPMSEAFVVHSDVDYEFEYEAQRNGKRYSPISPMRRSRGARSCGVHRRSRSSPTGSGSRTASGMRSTTLICNGWNRDCRST